MTHEIYSFAHINLPKIIVDQQFKVFDKFGLKINQIINDDTHGKNLENLIKNCKSDYIVIFDVDCIPLVKNIFDYINDDIQNYDLVGAIGCANHLNKNDIYVHPSFMFFKPQLYFDCGSPFLHEDHNNDVAQNFTRSCIKNNKKIKYWSNTNSNDYIWDLPNNTKFGHGTVYEQKVYHQFEIRKQEQHDSFIKKCKLVLEEL
jgi:hypothetical protein